MFICDCCKKPSKPNQRCHIKVTKTRSKDYFKIIEKNGEKFKVPNGRGSEIAHTQQWCQKCVDKENPQIVVAAEAILALPKRKSIEEMGEFKYKLPYDIQPSRFNRLEGLEAFLKR